MSRFTVACLSFLLTIAGAWAAGNCEYSRYAEFSGKCSYCHNTSSPSARDVKFIEDVPSNIRYSRLFRKVIELPGRMKHKGAAGATRWGLATNRNAGPQSLPRRDNRAAVSNGVNHDRHGDSASGDDINLMGQSSGGWMSGMNTGLMSDHSSSGSSSENPRSESGLRNGLPGASFDDPFGTGIVGELNRDGQSVWSDNGCICYRLKAKDRLSKVVGDIFRIELHRRGVYVEPDIRADGILDQVSYASWGAGRTARLQAGEIVKIPISLIDRYAEKLKSRETYRPSSVDFDDPFGNNRLAGMMNESSQGSGPSALTRDGSRKSAALREIESLEQKVKQVIPRPDKALLYVEDGMIGDDVILEKSRVKRLRGYIEDVIGSHETSAVMSLHLGLGAERSRIFDALTKLEEPLATDYLFGKSLDEVKAIALKKLSARKEELLSAVNALRGRVKSWNGAR